MTTEKTRAKVGDVMIYRKGYGEVPQRVNVAKVTKAGWVRFAHPDGSESILFKQIWDGSYDVAQQTRFARSHARLWPDDEAKWEELVKAAAEAQEERRRKDAEQAANRKAREDREATELAEVKAALNGEWRTAVLHTEMLENGSQVHMIRLPVRPDLVERKGATQLVVVRVAPEERWTTEGRDPTFAAYVTVADKTTTGSWSSYGGEYGPTADDAVWAALRYLRNNW